MKFSVLMSIYYKEKAEYFNRTMQSIWDEQSIKPNEIVLVQDGKLTEELYVSINKWKENLGDILKIIALKHNLGTGGAKNIGLQECNYEYIAVMDTDDISTPDRFKKQLEFLQEHKDIDVVGTYINEIDENENIVKDIVKFPLSHDELYNFFSKRDPLAHPTTMFRKNYFEKAGNYRSDLHLAEDTLLWYYGFLNDCKFANIDFVGLNFRRTSDFYKRRGDIKKSIGLLKYRLFNINKRLGYNVMSDFYAIGYFLISISPRFVKKIAYQIFR
jgi:glycosyltransferase involved in cell wall biosynthesis